MKGDFRMEKMEKINVDIDKKIVYVHVDATPEQIKKADQLHAKVKNDPSDKNIKEYQSYMDFNFGKKPNADQEDPGLEQKISMKEKQLESARVELKKISSPEAVLSQQEKILKMQHEIAELKDQLKDLNQK